ncbi:MAG: hypothetical protein MUP11_10505 [Anaerolineales bacterium]|nr:hypothetical protein [Anaerolineales bacterium]
MKAALDQTQEAKLTAFREITEKQLQQASGDNTIGVQLAGYSIHEAYHAGELEIL